MHPLYTPSIQPQGLDELLSALLPAPEDPPALTTASLVEDETDEDFAAAGTSAAGTAAAAAVAAAASAGGVGSDATSPAPSAAVGASGQPPSVAAAAADDSSVGAAAAALNPAASSISSSGGDGSVALSAQSTMQPDQQQQQQPGADDGEQQPLVKVVLARRTAIPWGDGSIGSNGSNSGSNGSSGGQLPLQLLLPGWQRRSGAVLLQALQERDPRAYQLLLSVPPGATFVACTPERLYVRSGRRVASEAVAGTRPRGAPGDLEADFYQVGVLGAIGCHTISSTRFACRSPPELVGTTGCPLC